MSVALPTSCVHTWRRCYEKAGQGCGCVRQATASECRQEIQSPISGSPRIFCDGEAPLPPCQLEACKPVCPQGRLNVPSLECSHVAAHKDIDLLGRLDSKVTAVVPVFKDVCNQTVEPDGLIVHADSVAGQAIKEDAD